MNLDDLYQNTIGFWESISPLLVTHTIAIVVIIWTMGSEWHILERAEYYINSDKFRRWKKILDEFDLLPKIPYIALVGCFLYLAVFNSAIGLLSNFEPMSIGYSEMDFWEENRPLDDATEIASYQTVPLRLSQVLSLKEKFLADYRAKYPNEYQSYIGWLSKPFGVWANYYRLSLIFVFFLLGLVFYQLRHKTKHSGVIIRKLLLVTFLTICAMGICRYQAEQYIEKQQKAELNFVLRQLEIDTQVKQTENILPIRCTLYKEFRETDKYPPHLFWLLRVLEKISIGEREFPHMTDNQFQNAYLNVEMMCAAVK